MARPSLTRAHRVLLGVVAIGACLISGIGFAGSYNAVRVLAMHKGFGAFSYAFPVGVDAGIVVLLSLDLVLTWLRIPFPLLRQTAWLLTGATIAFNAAASWGDALGMAMHAVIPVLFIVVVEASRHAVGRIAAITADRYMESVRVMRWILSPVPTFRLWRRMKLWELRSYDETVRLEQNRLVYRAQLRFRYGRSWRRSAPIEALLPLKLAKYGVPLDPTLLDRIDGPLHVGGALQAGQGLAGESGVTSQVSAAVAVPTLAKLAAVRLRDAQDPQQGAQPAQPGSSGALNVWAPRDGHAEAMGADGAHARVPGQASPWFKSPRPDRPAEPRVERGQRRQGQGVPRQAMAPRGIPVPPQGEPMQGEPMRIGPRPIRLEEPAEPEALDELAAELDDYSAQQHAVHPNDVTPTVMAEQLPFDQADATEELTPAPARGRRQLGMPLDPDVCFAALVEYLDSHDSQPDPQRFADYLTNVVGLTGSRADGSVSSKDLEKIWPKLQDRYVTSGRE